LTNASSGLPSEQPPSGSTSSLPTIEELCDADARERFLAGLMVGIVNGTVSTKDARCLAQLAKEMRDGADLRALTRELDVCRKLFKEFLSRKAGVPLEDIDAALRRIQQEVTSSGDTADED
jgi:hypothetical protein